MKLNILASISLILVMVLTACAVDNSNNDFDPNTPVDSDQPMPVEPDGGPGGDLNDEGKDQANARVEQAELLIMESYPVQVMLVVSGALPTPCHQFRYQVSEPDTDNQIFVEVYSVVDPGEVCIEVEDPFSENISLPVAGFPDGTYTVYVNGDLVGEFSYPA
jgi:inhibitor of cysteine peptidase